MKTRASLKTSLRFRNKPKFAYVSGLLLASIVLLVLIGTASATTYYVRTDGNNACNGLYNNIGFSGNCAFKSIAYGLSRLVAGDTLRVQQGTYNEGGLSVPSGNAANWVTVKGDDNPIINAAAIYGFSHTTNSYIIIEGFTIQGFDAGYYQEGGTFSNVIILNNNFIGGNRAVYIKGTGYGEDILIKGNDISGLSGDTELNPGATIDVGAAANPKFNKIIIENNIIHDITQNSHGIQFDGTNSEIKGNIIDSASKCITIGTGNNNIKILNNTVINCVRGIRGDYNNYNIEIGFNRVIDSGGQSFGLDLYPWRGSDIPYQYWIHDNIIDNSGMGLYSNYRDIIENNIFQNGDAGIFFSDSNSYEYEGSHIIRNNTFIGKAIELKTTKGNITITNNRFYDLEYAFNQCGFICWRGKGGFDGLYITNNDFYNTNGYNAINSDSIAGVISPVIVKNNIFHTVASGLSDSSNKFRSLSITYNLVYLNSGTAFGGKISSNTIHQDPLFADPAEGDFHVKSKYGRWTTVGWIYTDSVTSPAIDAGDPTFDYSKEPYPQGGRINIGAYGNTGEASKSMLSGDPEADPSASPTSGEAPLAVNFIGSGSDSDGTIVSYSWDFGDGNTLSLRNTTYTYTSAGTYNAVLTVTDNEGKTGSRTVTIMLASLNTTPPGVEKGKTSGPNEMKVYFLELLKKFLQLIQNLLD